MRVAKPNLGDAREATERRIDSEDLKLRKRREDKLKKKRAGSSNSGSFSFPDTAGAVLQLQSNGSLELLCACLKRDDVDMYFAPSNCHDYKGPYLFPDEASLQRLVNHLKNPNTLNLASSCLVNVSAHCESYTWCNRLIKCGILDACKVLLSDETTPMEVAENLIWMLANMCFDCAAIRDSILPLLPWCFQRSEASASFMMSALFYCSPAPPPETVKVFWINVVPQYFNNDKVIRGVMYACRDERYRQIVLDSGVLNFLDSPYIWEKFSGDVKNREVLITRYNIVEKLYAALVDQDPNVRELGARGLYELSFSKLSFEPLYRNFTHVLTQINHCRDYSRIYRPLYGVICNMVQNMSQQDHYEYFVYNNVFYHIKSMLTISLGDVTLMAAALKAVARLLKCNHRTSVQMMEESELTDQLEILTTHHDEDIRTLANDIIEKQESKGIMEVDEE